MVADEEPEWATEPQQCYLKLAEGCHPTKVHQLLLFFIIILPSYSKNLRKDNYKK